VQALSGKWWFAAPSYAALLLRLALGVAVFVFTLHDKEFPVYRALHGVTGSMCLVVSAFVSTQLHTSLLLLIRDDAGGYLEHCLAMYLPPQPKVAVPGVSVVSLPLDPDLPTDLISL
jgi:hypothetical protein